VLAQGHVNRDEHRPLIASAVREEIWESLHLFLFSLRQHICYSVLYAIARLSVRPSVCPSVCLSHGCISQRPLKLGSCNLHHRVAPWLVFWCLTSPRNSKGKIASGGTELESGMKNMQFSANKLPYLRNGAR